MQTLALPSTPNFQSCIIFTPVSLSETPHRVPPSRASSNSVIPTGVAGLFCRAVCGAPATERRDRGNQSTDTQLH
jgi:hypothetical protein